MNTKSGKAFAADLVILAIGVRPETTLAREDIKNTNTVIPDVRSRQESASGHVERAVNIPLDELRSRMHELPSEREIWIYCDVGQRSYYAVRALRLNQFKARNLSGGIHAYKNLAQS